MNTEKTKDEKPIQIDEEELKRINNEMILSDLITPDRIYLELILFKDFNISTILSFLREKGNSISSEEYSSNYNQIIHKLPEYNDRYFDDFESIFPFLNISNEQIKQRLYDSNFSGFIFRTAPVTKFLDVLRSQLFVNINHSAVSRKRDPIELTINTYPLQLSKEDQFITGKFFSETYKVNVRVMYLDMIKLKLSDLLKYDEVYTYHPKEIFDCEEIRHAYTEMKFINKRIYIPRLFGYKIDKNKNIEQEALSVQTRLEILTNFKYLHPSLFSTPVLSEEKEKPVDG